MLVTCFFFSDYSYLIWRCTKISSDEIPPQLINNLITHSIPPFLMQQLSFRTQGNVLAAKCTTTWPARSPRYFRASAIFGAKVYFKSPWELILNGPVPEEVKCCPSHWSEKYFSGQSAGRSGRVTLSSSSLVDLVVGPVQRFS